MKANRNARDVGRSGYYATSCRISLTCSPSLRRQASHWPWRFEEKQSFAPPVTSAVWTSDGSTFYQLNAKCQDLITLYLGRSLMAPTNPIVRQVNRSLLSLAFSVSRLQWLHCVCHRAGRDSANGAASTRF